MREISHEFFTRDPVDCARELVGCHFHWKGCVGRIVETEAYRGIGDEACHTFLRPSVREFVSQCDPGDAYVYLNYGVHWLFNIVAKGGKHEGFVLLRALEPVKGIEKMRIRRGAIKDRDLASGPGKLTKALGIGRGDHGKEFLDRNDRGISLGKAETVVSGPRIGISKSADFPWRFGDPESRCLSRRF